MTQAIISAITSHKNEIIRHIATWILPVLFCKSKNISSTRKAETSIECLKRMGKENSFKIKTETVGNIVFNGWGLPQFFPQSLKYLSSAEYFISYPTISGWLDLYTKGETLHQDNLDHLLYGFRSQEINKLELLETYQHHEYLAEYALFQAEIHKWIRGLIKCSAGLWTADVPVHTNTRLQEPSTPYLLSFIQQWRESGKPLTQEMSTFIDYLLSTNDEKIVGFPELKSTYLIGLVGEQIIAEELGGTVVGGLGRKTDVCAFNRNLSVKTTKNDHWQAHLAYLSIQDYPHLAKIVESHGSLRDLGFSDEQWAAFLTQFLSAQDNLEFIVFQKIQLHENENVILHQNVWICSVKALIQQVKQGHYFFRNTSFSIVAPNKEVVLSLQFKRRNEGKKIQVMVSTDTQLLQNATTCINGVSILKQELPTHR